METGPAAIGYNNNNYNNNNTSELYESVKPISTSGYINVGRAIIEIGGRA